MNDASGSDCFLITKEHRRFEEFCDACRRYRYIGLCYGAAGAGKTWSSRRYAHWDQIESLTALHICERLATPKIMACRSLFYTAPVAASPRRIEQEIGTLRDQFTNLLVDMDLVLRNVQVWEYPRNPVDLVELVIVDEADRLKPVGLEQLRDIYDRHQAGLVLVGMPGIEKRLSRYPQLYSRVGFVHHFKPLSSEEMHFVLERRWQQLGLTFDLDDFTDAEATAAIIRITGGNFRLIQRLLSQVERVMRITEPHYVTKEVVETARELLVIGPS